MLDGWDWSSFPAGVEVLLAGFGLGDFFGAGEGVDGWEAVETGSFCWSLRGVVFLFGEMCKSFICEVVVLIGSSVAWDFGTLVAGEGIV